MVDWADSYLVEVKRKIGEYGWMVQGTEMSRGGPLLSYSVGLWPHAGFELLLVGLPFRMSQTIINDLAKRVMDGLRFTHGERLSDVINAYDVTMIEIPQTGIYLGVANRMYRLTPGENIAAWQIVFPDTKGRFPWEPDNLVAGQTILGEVPQPKETPDV